MCSVILELIRWLLTYFCCSCEKLEVIRLSDVKGGSIQKSKGFYSHINDKSNKELLETANAGFKLNECSAAIGNN